MKIQRKTNKQKIIFNSKKEFVKGHSFMTSTKISKFRTPTHLFPSIHNHPILKFWSKQIPVLDVLNSHLHSTPAPPPPWPPWKISNSFLIVNAYSIYYSHMYDKTDRKANSFSPIRIFVKGYCTFGVSIKKLQAKYKRSFRMETV